MSRHFENVDLVLSQGQKIEVGGAVGIGKDSLSLKNTSSEPGSSGVDQIEIYAKDSSAGATDATLALRVETNPVAIGSFTATHKIPIWINGVEYHISLDAV